jgi:hypothetical protein
MTKRKALDSDYEREVRFYLQSGDQKFFKQYGLKGLCLPPQAKTFQTAKWAAEKYAELCGLVSGWTIVREVRETETVFTKEE